MKKYLLLAFLSLLAPLSANTITPKFGHYEGTSVDFNYVSYKHISFDLVPGRQALHPDIEDFKLTDLDFKKGKFANVGRGTHVFHFDTATSDYASGCQGHGKWETDTKVAGDFRVGRLGSAFNTYYTFDAHWVRK